MAAPIYPWSTSTPRLLIDLTGHFVWLYLGFALLTAVRGRHAVRWLSLTAAVANLFVLGTATLTGAPIAADAAAKGELRVISANLFAGNKTPEKLRELVAERQPPDVLFLQEVTPAGAQALAHLPGYPYRKLVVRKDAFGIAILSRHRLENVTVVDEAPYGLPTIAATLRWNGTRVALRAVHPLPPISPKAYAARNTLLSKNAKELAASRLPALMAGDFNATPWSAGWNVVQQAGLARATSLRPTWPAHSWIPAVIPIDHITTSPHWVVRESRRGPDIGSDHFPVEAVLVLRQ